MPRVHCIPKLKRSGIDVYPNHDMEVCTTDTKLKSQEFYNLAMEF
jgi:hypothetical protein